MRPVAQRRWRIRYSTPRCRRFEFGGWAEGTGSAMSQKGRGLGPGFKPTIRYWMPDVGKSAGHASTFLPLMVSSAMSASPETVWLTVGANRRHSTPRQWLRSHAGSFFIANVGFGFRRRSHPPLVRLTRCAVSTGRPCHAHSQELVLHFLLFAHWAGTKKELSRPLSVGYAITAMYT